MICPKCGNDIPEGGQFCKKCGNLVQGSDAATQSLNPAATATAEQQTSGKAVGSLITGLLGLLVFPASITAVVLGHMSRSEIRKSAGRLKGSGMALAGLILGYSGLSLIPIAIILIIAAIAIPNLLRARIAANEAAAASVIRTINGAELSYRHSFPSVGYTCSLASLREMSTLLHQQSTRTL